MEEHISDGFVVVIGFFICAKPIWTSGALVL